MRRYYRECFLKHPGCGGKAKRKHSILEVLYTNHESKKLPVSGMDGDVKISILKV